MGIQDDIFDVEHALRRKPEKASFERIVGYLSNLEEREDKSARHLSRLADGMKAFKELLK